MRPIKFRGKSKYSDKIIYGDFNHGKENVYVDDEPVYPESVAQLVGYDCNGNEVYEDDILIDSYGCGVVVKDLCIHYDEIGSRFECCKLKK